MKIAQIPPLIETIPPKLYGGTERIVAYLSDALVALGHDVTLFASGDAVTSAKLVPVRDQAIRFDPAPKSSDVAAHFSMMHEVRSMADEFDVLHFHIDLLHFPFFEDIADRTVTTLHGRLDIKDLPEFYRRWNAYPLVSISDNHRLPLATANWLGTVHHGLPPDLHRPPTKPRGDYLAFLGRMSPEKGPADAIAIANAVGMRLKMAAKVDQRDRVYFRETIEPLLNNPLIEFVGEITDSQKAAFLGNARALLFPIDWPEPFGLAMIEAMASGTPVIAYPRGSVAEIIDENVTGLIVRSVDEAAAAVDKVAGLDRRRIRATFDKRFSAGVMARKYLNLYRRGLVAHPPSKVTMPAPVLTGLPQQTIT
jgi:glycosyltransferase involved in cell wall biosynthesis